jgi:hypothetical protein
MSSEKYETLAGILCAVLALSSGIAACSSDSKPSNNGTSGSSGEAGTPGSSGDGGVPSVGGGGGTPGVAGDGGMPSVGGDGGTPGAGGTAGIGGDAGASGAGGAPAEPPSEDDSLCGERPGGLLWADHVVRFETADGDVVQLARTYEGSGVGESSLYGLDGMALRVDGEEICVGAGDTLEYTNTHHNWHDVASGTKDGIRYEYTANFDAEDTLAIFDENDDAILSPTPLIQTGAPPFCINCMRSFTLGISEVVANNTSLYPDEASEHEPLIELYNVGSDDIDLTGWTLSNAFAERDKWTFPSVTIPRHETLVIFADGDTSQGSLHTNFELSADGGQLVLTAPSGKTDGGFVYGPQAADESLAYSWSTGGYETLDTPTPGEPPPE